MCTKSQVQSPDQSFFMIGTWNFGWEHIFHRCPCHSGGTVKPDHSIWGLEGVKDPKTPKPQNPKTPWGEYAALFWVLTFLEKSFSYQKHENKDRHGRIINKRNDRSRASRWVIKFELCFAVHRKSKEWRWKRARSAGWRNCVYCF